MSGGHLLHYLFTGYVLVIVYTFQRSLTGCAVCKQPYFCRILADLHITIPAITSSPLASDCRMRSVTKVPWRPIWISISFILSFKLCLFSGCDGGLFWSELFTPMLLNSLHLVWSRQLSRLKIWGLSTGDLSFKKKTLKSCICTIHSTHVDWP